MVLMVLYCSWTRREGLPCPALQRGICRGGAGRNPDYRTKPRRRPGAVTCDFNEFASSVNHAVLFKNSAARRAYHGQLRRNNDETVSILAFILACPGLRGRSPGNDEDRGDIRYGTVFPGERALQATNSGEYDADIGRTAGVLGPYPNLMYTNEPLITVDLTAWVKKGSKLVIVSAADLKKYRIGYQKGSKLAEAYVASAGLTGEGIADLPSLARMLAGDRIDVALMSSSVISSEVYDVGSRVLPELMRVSSFHVLNRKHAALAPKLDAAIKAMKTDGRFQKLLSGT